MSEQIPTAVLSERLQEIIASRRVRVAVFTTFRFEPGFFDEEVVPLLFERSFSHIPQIRLLQLEEELRSIEHIAVYYDRGGLMKSTHPGRLDVRRIPLARKTGYFHPKLVLLLVENEDEEGTLIDSLIVGVLSANLTQAGWWENVECADFLEFEDRARCSIRRDLLNLIRVLKAEDRTGEEHAAIEEIREFVAKRLTNETFKSSKGYRHPRLFVGQDSLASFLRDHFRVNYETYNLEIISPYFDDTYQARVLEELIDTLRPKTTRIFLPRADDGTALCWKRYYEAVASIPGVEWAKLPPNMVQRSKSAGDTQTDRFVHAKVYRFWSRVEETECVVVGSVNLTSAAHGESKAGNLEAAILTQRRSTHPGFWLSPLEGPAPSAYRPEASEDESEDDVPPPLTVRHLWGQGRTEYFWEKEGGPRPRKAAFASSGSPVHKLERIVFGKWVPFPDDVSETMGKLLQSTSFIDVAVDDGPPCTLLVREEEMAHKPSLLFSLSVEDILRYWSLLSAEQREAFLVEKAAMLQGRPELIPTPRHPVETEDSLFDKFAGIFHAFARLEEHVRQALDRDRTTEAVYRLFGEKYDSLPSVLRKVLEDDEGDLVNRYVTILTAARLVEKLKKEYREFFSEHRREEKALRRQLNEAKRLRSQFQFESKEVRQRFFDWFDKLFHMDISPRQSA